ncbi:AI-2E family transporter [Christensenellaceae bacterium 44-20]
MRIDWNKKYTTITAYAVLAAGACILICAVVFNLGEVFSTIRRFLFILNPFLWGFALAYMFNKPVQFFEQRVFRFRGKKGGRSSLARTLSIAAVYLIVLLALVGLFFIILPELSSSISAFVQNLPGYLRDLDTAFRDLITKFHLEKYVGDMDSLYAMIDSAMEYAKTIAPEIANIGFQITVSAISGISDALLALVVSAYLLSSKELFIAQVKKATYALFPQKFAGSIILLSRETNDIFGGYISGKLMQSFCLFALNFIAMAIMRLPYAALISAIMGITDIIPFFGPFIGAVPSAILLFLVEPKYALIFVILTIVTQQIDAQIIGPRILGESTGLTAFWVVFAIILGGGLFGVPGMILGIPLFAVLYSVVRQFMNSRLEQQGLSTNSKDYHSPSV